MWQPLCFALHNVLLHLFLCKFSPIWKLIIPIITLYGFSGDPINEPVRRASSWTYRNVWELIPPVLAPIEPNKLIDTVVLIGTVAGMLR